MVMSFQSDFLYPDVIPHHARFSGGRTAVIHGNRTLTWSQLELRTRKVANALFDAGLKKGDKVCLYMRNSLAAFELFWGVIRSGGVVVALNTMVSPDALTVLVNNSDGRWLFTDSHGAPMVEDIASDLTGITLESIYSDVPHETFGLIEDFVSAGSEDPVDVRIDPEDTLNIVYSSGSTGIPKGIEQSHLSRHNYTFGTGHYFGFDADSVTILATALYANGTWQTMGPTMFRGGCIVLMDKFDALGFITEVERCRCTHVFLVPTQTVAILAHPEIAQHDMSSLRIIVSAGQPLAPATFEEVQVKLPHVELWEGYGMSEGFGTIVGPPDYAKGKQGSVGKGMFLDDIRIIDPNTGTELPQGEIGEICGYSMGLMKGYYKDPERTRETVWTGPRGRTYLRSGDLGRLDEDGYLYICGRAKDMIKSGGINVFPADIEAVFTAHPAVQEVAALGIFHEKWMETPLLFAILRKDGNATAPELKAWGNERLSKYQRVSEVVIVDDLPRANYGKVDKVGLKQLARQHGFRLPFDS
ncbi:class I adenylate-forming enzyme family protein [Novosphingobium pentaromativorans]|uniref:AMP-dependent synthetase and ligase n=1 Tax=Novosphingobium pentaromativorans US6-1 TaxID=1088721 RepID=G6EGQ2_9SPHN|nr:class I adenylate-forming enzyme family protein [Novosphingobium pentaromativorans]AIT82095.1 hypothetical protein JI59_21405 [Novosphingobium pentaromativorans US6-1]EHJ59495.1 hypothetical protein NSU_3523 [Novosphingobium pentaromativorans US6-1]